MKGNLTIDNGNTSVKVAYFIGTQFVAASRFERRDLRLLDRFISSYKPASAMVCGTAAATDSRPIEQLVEQRCKRVLHLSDEMPLPIVLDYKTPHTLGRDRIATAVGAWSRGQDTDTLVIDAGTAITYDMVTANGHFAGGNIAPGVALRFRALHEHTGALPLVDRDGDTPLLGYDTATAIRSGVMHGLLGEVRSYISRLRLSHPGLAVYLTGGDGKLLHGLLQDEGVIYQEHLAAEGLNRIYLYNEANETV